MDLNTPVIFARLYRYYRASGHGRRTSLHQAWRCIAHRI